MAFRRLYFRWPRKRTTVLAHLKFASELRKAQQLNLQIAYQEVIMKAKNSCFSTALVIIIGTASVGLLFSACQTSIDVKMEKSLLAEDWKYVIDNYSSSEELNSSPILRAIKGHACLALNRNNESLLLFLSITHDSATTAWNIWSQKFLERNSTSPIAHYFRGDALARRGEFDLAVQSFTQALKYKTNFALALNARGVVYSSLKEWNKAYNDLEEACKIDTTFAEAFGSHGTLLVIKKASASDDTYDFFNKALAISPQFALALNGRGCAAYGRIKWEEANRDFAAAGRILPLQLFWENLRALAVAAENVNLPGFENSPMFRVTDFLDWETLHKASLTKGDILSNFLSGQPLPDTLTISAIKRLNQALNNAQFYDQIKSKVDIQNASEKLMTLINQTQDFRNRLTSDLADAELEKIRILNRMLLELAYPYLIAKHDQRDPGMQLSLTRGGLIDDNKYLKNLSPVDIAAGQWRVDHLWQPFADALESSGMPVIDFVGSQLNRHLDRIINRNDMYLRKNYGIELDEIRPGGVLIDYRRAFVDKGEWPVVNWFGLAYVSH